MKFQALSQHCPPDEGECYYFGSFQDYLDQFPLLWKILSPEGVAENRAYRDIALHRSPRIPSKASETIPDPMRYRYRDDFQENIRALANLLLEEIEDNQEVRKSFYRDCYVSVDANNRHTMLSKQTIKHRYRHVAGDGIVPKQLRAAAGSENSEVEFSEPALEANLSSRPIIVLGDVGLGKTSFFENLSFGIESQQQANQSLRYENNSAFRKTLTTDIQLQLRFDMNVWARLRF